MQPREYQQRAVQSVIEKWEKHPSTLVVCATGLGKTHIAAELIRHVLERTGKRCLFLAHMRELIHQGHSKIEAVTGLQCEIEMGDLVARTSLFSRAPIVVSSIQTQCAGDPPRMQRFNPNEFGLVIADEAHHYTAPSFRKVLSHYQQNPDLRLAGFTATPDRTDQEALGQIFGSVAFDYGILDGIADGWLVDITQQFCPVAGLDFSHIETVGSGPDRDFHSGQLKAVMEAEWNVQGICQPSLEVMFGLDPKTLSSIPVPQWGDRLRQRANDPEFPSGTFPRRTLVFTHSVAQAEMACNIFNRVWPGLFEWVCGETRKEERKEILSRFARGITAGCANCACLTEGYDCPQVEVIINAKPTKSRSRYAQILGRSTRPLPGIVDGLETAEQRREAIANSRKKWARIIDFTGACGEHKLVSCADILGGKVSEAAAERAVANAKATGKVIRVSRDLDKAEVELKKEQEEKARQARLAQEARNKNLVAKSKFELQLVDAFGSPNGHKVTQRKFTGAKGLSDKQQSVLRRAGVDPNYVTALQGRHLIGVLAKNNWRWPKRKSA